MKKDYTTPLTDKRIEGYAKAKEKAKKIIEVIDNIMENNVSEGKACSEVGLPVQEFRQFCKNKVFGEKLPHQVMIGKRDWKEQLLFMVFGGDYIPVHDDFEETYKWIQEKLEEREADCLDMYIKGYTYEEIGKKYSVTMSRARNIVLSVIYKLRRRPFAQRLMWGIVDSKQIEEEEKWLAIQRATKEHGRKIFLSNLDKSKAEKMRETRISELNFSTRIRNVLYDENIFTVADMIDNISKLDNMKNLGEKSKLEIKEKLELYSSI